MKRRIFCCLAVCALLAAPAVLAQPRVGMTDTTAYFPLLEGRRVAVLANQTSVADMPGAPGADASGRVHLVDLLHRQRRARDGASSRPSTGSAATADAGRACRQIRSTRGRGCRSGRSTTAARADRPDEAMRSFDVLLVDMQDVGLRFYTYYISMLRMMDACADFGRAVVVLDRPNPNGSYIDGPVLDMKYKSGVGALPIPVVHGLTMGEIARMAVGEGWAKPCDLTVVPCRRYTHATRYRAARGAVAQPADAARRFTSMPSICLFEGTVVSLGRGTDRPFECYGHPDMRGRPTASSFTPRPTDGAKHPPLEGRVCRGVDLSEHAAASEVRAGWVSRCDYVIDAYRDLEALGEEFFTPMFEKLDRRGVGAPDDPRRSFRRGDPRPLAGGRRAFYRTAGEVSVVRIGGLP